MKKVKFNAVDVIIILAVAVVIVLGALYAKGLFGGKSPVSADREVMATYTVEFTNKEIELTELPKVGDTVSIGVKEKLLASVTDVQVNPARKVTYDLSGNGSARWEEIPNHYDILITLQSDAVESESSVRSSNVALRVGDTAVVRGKGYSAEGYILSLDTEDKGGAK